MKINIRPKSKSAGKPFGVIRPKLKLNSGSRASHDSEEDDDDEESGISNDVPGWLMTDRADQRAASNEARHQRERTFIPELWLKPDEERVVRFRHPRSLGTFWAYSCKKKNGKFDRVTAPEKGEVDLFRDELGMRPSFKAIYEVIDIEGYKDAKTGKRKRNLPRFYVASHKIYEQLEKLADKLGGLDTRNIEISRIGEGNQTTYQFMPLDKSPMTSEMKAAEMLKPKAAKMFAPPNEAEQRGMLSSIVPNTRD